MKVRVTNFGPIEDAEFELGDVTVVIGPNASGKSFLSYMLYSVLTARPLGGPEDLKELPVGEVELRPYLDAVNKVLSRALRESFEGLFGVRYGELITIGRGESRITFTDEGVGSLDITLGEEFKAEVRPDKDVGLFINFVEVKDVRSGIVDVKIARTDAGGYRVDVYYGTELLSGSEAVEAEKRRVLASTLSQLVLGLFFRGFIPAVLLPAERDLVMSNLSGYITTYISGGKLSDASDKPVIRDFVRSLVSAMRLLRGEELSIGSLNIKYKVVEPFVLEVYEKGERIPLPLLSSGYAQVLSIHILSRFGKSVIIEEPELNLHAGAQVKVADLLYDLVEKEDKRLFLTTHSDIFAVQMAINHVKRGKSKGKTLKIYLLNEGKMEELAYTERGDIESIPTITDVIREQAKEIYGE